MFEEIISAGIVSIVILMLLITLPGESPLKKLLSTAVVSRLFYYYVTFYLTFAVILLFWTTGNWCWKSISFQSYSIISRLEARITKLFFLIILSIPARYILRLMIIPSSATKHISTNSSAPLTHERGRSVPLTAKPFDKRAFKTLIFGPSIESNSKKTPFQLLETTSTLHNISVWSPLSAEIFELSGLFQLFTKVRLHGLKHIPTDRPCMIIVNHALGHGFDVPMMVYILRKYCNMPRVRILVSAKHYNYPMWADLVYYLGGVPRTHQVTEHLMKCGENIIMFAAKKKKTSMIWDSKRRLYLDLVHKYDYVLVPAVCVSDDDVINMVYNFSVPSKIKTDSVHYENDTDTDTDNEEEENKTQSFDVIKNRLRRGYRKQYHLRFSEPIGVPKDERRRKKSEDLDDDGFDKLDYDEHDSVSVASSTRSGKEVKFSGINIFEDDNEESIDYGRKRRWSRELEVGLKTAVEDAMTDGISEMYMKLKTDPHSSLLQTIQKKMYTMSPTPNEYATNLQHDLRSTTSNDVPIKAVWME